MRKPLSLLALVAVALLGAGCFTKAPIQPPKGILLTTYEAPLDFNFDSSEGVDLTKLRQGFSEANYFWEPFLGTSYGFGDAEIRKAAQQGQLTKVYFADYKMTNVLGFVYTNTKVTVYGE